MENCSSDKIKGLFLSYQDMKTEVRRLESDLEMKKTKKAMTEKQLNAMESKIRTRENLLHSETLNLKETQAVNAKLKQQAENERVEQYEVYLQLLEGEDALKTLNEERMARKAEYADKLKEMATIQFKKREDFKNSLGFFNTNNNNI